MPIHLRLRFRPRVRTMMLLVAAVALAVWLGKTAWDVGPDADQSPLCHLRRYRDTGDLFVYGHALQGTWWSRYRRKLLNQPWPGSYPCDCGREQEAQTRRATVDIATDLDMNRLEDLMASMSRSK